MDIADDIAYSTYDLEDSLKAGFLTPAKMLSSDGEMLTQVARKVAEELRQQFEITDVLSCLIDLFGDIFFSKTNTDSEDDGGLVSFVKKYRASQAMAADSYLRTKLSSQLVGEGVKAVEVDLNEEYPMLSAARLTPDAKAKVEVLKQYTYCATIYSSRVKLPEYRGYEVVKGIFKALSGEKGYLLMPDDVRALYEGSADLYTQMRTVCDFVAGMTDRYAMEFYGRLHSDSAQSMFKPV